MFHLSETVKKRYKELNKQLVDIRIVQDTKKYVAIKRESLELKEIISKNEQYEKLCKELEDAEKILKNSQDAELIELAREEIETLSRKKRACEVDLINLLSAEPDDKKDAIVEIRAGAGGEEASLFVSNLFRMYSRYIERKGWKLDIMNSHPTGLGGFKEVIFAVEGKNVFGNMKYESGVHRVQRVPVTESSGRIHTSTTTVAVLLQAEEVEVNIEPDDLKVEAFRASGHGGQHVNVTDSAVRLTHIPTGIVVSCQDERSQHKNKIKAMKVLRARILDVKKREQEKKRKELRRSQVKSGDRSEKIRTYNFPQRRVTDHRINLTLHRLNEILDGELDLLIEELQKRDGEEKIEKLMG